MARYLKADEDLRGDEAWAESLRQRHPDLYGKLLEIHDEVNECGTLTFGAYIVTVLVAYAALWTGWYQRIPALQPYELNHVWTYAALFFAAWFTYAGHHRLIQRCRYGPHRLTLQNLAGAAGLNRHQLVARLEGDPAVKEALSMVKRDRWDFGISSLGSLGG